jgi:RNA polymerase sigma-54 factor
MKRWRVNWGVSINEIADAAHLIASLEPKPSRGYEQDEIRTVLPDVFVEKVGNDYVIYLNDDGVPRLRVSSLYSRMAGQEGEAVEQARQYSRKSRAATAIKSIQQRQRTLFRVTQSIFKFQQEFLDHGVSRLKPWCCATSPKIFRCTNRQ